MRQSGVNPTSPTRSGGGFPTYPPPTGSPRNPHAPAPLSEPGYGSDFTALQLLRVMSRLTQPGVRSLPYFMLCREFGVRAVDGMVRGRILDLRWMDPVTKEGPELSEGVVSQPGLDRTVPTVSPWLCIGAQHYRRFKQWYGDHERFSRDGWHGRRTLHSRGTRFRARPRRRRNFWA